MDELGIAGSPELLGHVSEPDPALCRKEADVLVITSYPERLP